MTPEQELECRDNASLALFGKQIYDLSSRELLILQDSIFPVFDENEELIGYKVLL